MNYYAYVPTAEGKEPLGTFNKLLFQLKTDRGAIKHAVRSFGHRNFRLFRYRNLYDETTFTPVFGGEPPRPAHATKKSPTQLQREITEALATRASVRPGAMPMAYVVPGARVPIPAITPSQHAAFEARRTKKGTWSVVVEDGYVKVKRDGETIAAGIDTGGKRLAGIEFMRPEYQKSNPTRQKAMRMFQKKGYR